MQIFDLKDVWHDGTALIHAKVQPGGVDEPMELWYRYEGLDDAAAAIADPFISAMLPSCMYHDEPCHAEGMTSHLDTSNLERAQNVLSEWYDELQPVRVDTVISDETATEPAKGVACCFSGGVDSWYTLLKNQDRITHILLVRGFDIGLDNCALWERTRLNVRRVAKSLGLRMIICETNLRDVADLGRADWAPNYNGDFWGRCLHGAALASCCLGLQGTIGELIVPATHEFTRLRPWGSSPRLDRYWSNGDIKITHDGCEADRLEKVRAIAESKLALETLRVCHCDTLLTNCGQCEKCMRTKLQLHLCGALDRTESFPLGDPFRKLKRLDVPPHVIHHYEALLDEAYRIGKTDVVEMVEKIVGKRFSIERMIAFALRRARKIGQTYDQVVPTEAAEEPAAPTRH